MRIAWMYQPTCKGGLVRKMRAIHHKNVLSALQRLDTLTPFTNKPSNLGNLGPLAQLVRAADS